MKTLNEQIEKYLKGKMSGKELSDFENLISEDEFLADAIEGYKKMHASTDDLKVISGKFTKNNKKRRWLYGIVYSGVAASVIVVGVFLLSSKENKVFQPELISKIKQDTIEYYNDKEYVSEFYFEDTVKTIIIIEEIAEKENYVTELREIAPEPVYISESISPLYINKNMIIENENEVKEEDISQYYRFRSNHKYMYIGDFKVVDYRFAKGRLNNYSIDNLSGNSDKQNYSYMAFLEQTMDKLKNKKYYEAIDDFNIILENYPDDQNALFYKGICYYEVNKNKQSMKFFDKTLNSKINTFHEDAKWYKGLIYKKEREYEIAMKVLEEIVDEKGYYGVQAKKELDEIYKFYLNE